MDALGGRLTAQSEAVRLQAAKAVLECGPRLRESLELARRLEALEAERGGQALPEEDRP